MHISRRSLVSGSLVSPLAITATAAAKESSDFETKDYTFVMLAPEMLPLNAARQTNLLASSRVDANGIVRFGANGEEQTHPVALAQHLLKALVNHVEFDEDGALEIAIANGDFLIEEAIEVEGAYYFPYSAPFKVHGLDSDALEAPWFSGMGQGQVLTAFLRLFEASGESRWKEAADKTFASFIPINDDTRPWSSTTEKYGTLWFEEFPVDPPCTALNGHVFAAFGLYEYWLLTQNPEALNLLRGAFYTVEKLGVTYRNPGEVSAYCLEHRATSLSYHSVHVAQLLSMYSMTQDPVFAHLHDDFYADVNSSTAILGTLMIPAGRVETYSTWAAGGYRDREIIEFPEPVEVRIDQRFKVAGANDYVYRISDGELEGLLVREQPFGIVLDGLVSGGKNAYGPLYGTIRYYDPQRAANFLAAPLYVYKNDEGQLGERIPSEDFVMQDVFQVIAAGIANGSQLTLVDSNIHGEVWISGSPRYVDREEIYEW